MNYLLLALAIICAVFALNAIVTIVRVAVGKARWNSEVAFYAQTAYAAVFGTAAAWLLGLALA